MRCHTGWKSVEIRPSAEFHEASKSALIKHYSTIEDLFVASVKYSSEELRLLLSSAPNLQTLITITDGEYIYGPIPQIDSSIFIDQDPDTGLLRPWACESSLKDLRVRIGDISDGENEEAQHVQHQVYERLSRFTKLEKLWLGGNPHPYDDYDSGNGDEWGLYDFQHDGLVMSLRSALDKLKGLKELRVLSVSRMYTLIGMEEIKWMVEHWPKLRVIRGIGTYAEARIFKYDRERILVQDWVKANHPRVQLLKSKESSQSQSQSRSRSRSQSQSQSQSQPQTQATDSLPVTTLAKYGRWIKIMPSVDELIENLKPPAKRGHPSKGKAAKNEVNPTTTDLIRHLLERCPNAVAPDLRLTSTIAESPGMLDILVKHFLPGVQDLEFSSSDYHGKKTPPFKRWMLKFLLNRCSCHLKTITFHNLKDGISNRIKEKNIKETQEREQDEDKDEDVSMSVFRPEKLILEYYSENAELNKFWSWLWKRCGSVETLDLTSMFGKGNNLMEGISNHMPNLCKLQFGQGFQSWPPLKDENIANILSSCHSTLKYVKVRVFADFSEASKSALIKHYPTLEYLSVPFVFYNGDELLHLLSSSSKLQTLIAIYNGSNGQPLPTYIESDMFIDLDPITGSLKSWKCEETLKVLRLKIRDIPRPDLGKQDGVIEESFPGQGLQIQNRVYERLARFTKLEELWLGGASGNIEYSYGFEIWQLLNYQLDCLEMSLKSGLGKLKGLKELRVLSLSNMSTRIGLKDIQWMVKHWPKLSYIRGINSLRDDYFTDRDKVHNWLKEHHPEIEEGYSDMRIYH
ncbi:hypothetical protein BGZ49_005177 [Haplosporangium sp. Z 27]|nr:hypothetical protein BGZ49_005177 [Haplosporangium sp. Z 27]